MCFIIYILSYILFIEHTQATERDGLLPVPPCTYAKIENIVVRDRSARRKAHFVYGVINRSMHTQTTQGR